MSDKLRFTPHVTVANVVHCQGKFLLVEEHINGKVLYNQPAGHLEANESVLEAARRELWEESGLRMQPQSLLKIFQWTAPDGTPFIRFTFAIDLDQCPPCEPQDPDIVACHWVSADEMRHMTLRSPLVMESITLFLQPERIPLSVLAVV
ncbi:NUDIX domain-containing protein [Plesiomonas shigelloides]|uniref:NUDIX hydrolase n=1 Tax=Plesiomonas shigelloides TaxID=703 RepID=UPI00126198B1|nr:NUDIX hydrolase [Plesiomonas shigelloides]KAB7705416.1 NUDIX domain-containing protein [Plesiomonas shigelloides]